MSIIESTATALVRFTGLGMVVFNDQKKRGEIAIIRDELHQLSIKIQQPKFKDGAEKDVIVYEDIASYLNLQKNDVGVSINTNGNSTVKGYEIYQADGEFNRLEAEDVNDYRWIVDMKSLHGENLVKAKDQDRFPISKTYIENGLFYAHKLDTNLFFAKIEKDSDGKEVSREVFGNVAETIGVKLESDEVCVDIKIGDQVFSHSLKRVTGLPYRIEISNMNHDEDALKSDMPDYYKYQTSNNGVKFELEPIKEQEGSGDSVAFKVFCHPIGGGGDIVSIEDFE
jgi:hypothetical protein